MYGVKKSPKILGKCAHTARFLKHAWPFFNILHESVKYFITLADKVREISYHFYNQYESNEKCEGVGQYISILQMLRCRSSLREVFCKKSCSEKFPKIYRKKPVPEPLFNKVAGLSLQKKRLWHRCFPVNFAKFLRTPFLSEHLQWLLLPFIFSETYFRRMLIWRNWYSYFLKICSNMIDILCLIKC